MKRAATAAVVLAAGLFFLVSCQQYLGSPGDESSSLPSPEAKTFWTYIDQVNPYTEWNYFPGYEGMYPGKSPHGAYLKLYANEAAYRAAKNGEKMPDGAILVKENYAKDKETLAAITPMYKVKGYNPTAGNWFWAKYGPDGKAAVSGKVDSCIKCHNAAKGNDYLFTKPR